jgi:hypothetical protein
MCGSIGLSVVRQLLQMDAVRITALPIVAAAAGVFFKVLSDPRRTGFARRDFQASDLCIGLELLIAAACAYATLLADRLSMPGDDAGVLSSSLMMGPVLTAELFLITIFIRNVGWKPLPRHKYVYKIWPGMIVPNLAGVVSLMWVLALVGR